MLFFLIVQDVMESWKVIEDRETLYLMILDRAIKGRRNLETLQDRDLVEFIRFLCERYRVSPEEFFRWASIWLEKRIRRYLEGC